MHSIPKIFKKYFLSFFIAFIIPVTFIITPLFSIGHNIFVKELREKDITTVNLSMTRLNNKLENCLFIANNLITNDYFTQFSSPNSSSEGLRLIQSLSNYLSANPSIHDAIVYFKTNDYAYSSTTSMSADSFYLNYTTPTYTLSAFKELINNLSEPLFIDKIMYENTEYFALLIPLTSYYEQIGCVTFLFDPSVLYNVLLTDKDSTRQYYFLDSHSLEQSLSLIDFSYLSTFNYKELIDTLYKLPSQQEAYFSDVNNYSVYAYKPYSYIPNLILLSTISHEEVFHPLHILSIIMFGSILIAFIFILMSSYYIARHNYASIEEMSYSLTKLKKGYSALEDEMNKHIPIRQYFLLNQLVNGNITNIPDFTQNCMKLGIDLSAPYHGIMLVKSPSASFALDETVFPTIEGLQNTKILYYYIIRHLHSHINIYLVGISSDISHSFLSLPEAKLYFGSFSQRLSHIPKSYIDARNKTH